MFCIYHDITYPIPSLFTYEYSHIYIYIYIGHLSLSSIRRVLLSLSSHGVFIDNHTQMIWVGSSMSLSEIAAKIKAWVSIYH